MRLPRKATCRLRMMGSGIGYGKTVGGKIFHRDNPVKEMLKVDLFRDDCRNFKIRCSVIYIPSVSVSINPCVSNPVTGRSGVKL